MSMWTMNEREEINKSIQYEESLNQLAYKAYAEAKARQCKLKDILKNAEYKPLTDYYSYDQIVDDVLKYQN